MNIPRIDLYDTPPSLPPSLSTYTILYCTLLYYTVLYCTCICRAMHSLTHSRCKPTD